MSEPGKPKGPTHLHKLVLDLTAPIKFNKMELELNRLMVMVGKNDSGKTFLLKVAYAICTTAISQGGPMGTIDAAQFVFNNTFTDQNLNGSVKGVFTQGSCSVDLHEGKVVSVEMDVVNPAIMVFMSSDMRTFDQMNLYLRMKSEAGADPVIGLGKMLKAYRLYDITYMEPFIAKCPIAIPPEVLETLKSTYGFQDNITSVECDMENCVFNAVMEDGSKRALSTYGKGHQAVLNMFLGVSNAPSS